MILSNHMKAKYELLAPAGSFESLVSAIENGADAVYFGLKEFSMRATAKNFSIKDLNKISLLCKPKKIKKYATINTIIYDSELKKLDKLIKKLKNHIDAIICWDLSVIQLCKKYRIPFHISTQASVSNSDSASFYKKLGAERIVLARELNLKQIKKISKIIPVECFCHGALCVSISGRCFTSQFLNCKSANRGECIHPCRKSYLIKDIETKKELILENNRVMSAKDLCTLPFIERMKKAGIVSFKIEGRNRSPEYVAMVVKEYKKALNKKLSREEIKESLKNLKKVYNRGFSSGFYIKMPTSDDFSFSENGEQTESKTYIGRVEKYWPKANVAGIRMHYGKMKLKDEIYIIGKECGSKRITIERIEMNKKEIGFCKKGDFIGIKVSDVKKGDEVYLIKKKAI
jgi:U32 family peptidase